MSRGFGRIQRALQEIFEAIGGKTYSISELCALVYDEASEKKHRVAVLRAVDSVAKRYPSIGKFRGGERWTYYFCDCSNLWAYAITQERLRYGYSHEQAQERLRCDLEHDDNIHEVKKYMEPETGMWWLYSAAMKAERDGDKARAETLWTKYEKVYQKYIAGINAMFQSSEPVQRRV
jgi:hypothetical protein